MLNQSSQQLRGKNYGKRVEGPWVVGMVCQSKINIETKKQIQEKSRFKYKFIDIDDKNYAGSANVLYFNNFLAIPSHLLKIYEDFPEFKGLKEVKPLPNRELFKIDGCLTCRSVFFSSGK